ncbi:MAG TPA: peptide chain release factor N(5)-glutamine methyltransferase [Candidatus Binatia bacterium]|nr:peptide chain release factor N(5)-glutamine methyltransferase [Candidatus Binatia bacterium]
MSTESPSRTVAATLADATARLAAAGVPEPRADAEVLLANALRTNRAGLVVRAREAIPNDATARLGPLLRRREGREPVSHLVGEREFWSLPIRVDRRVLTPRPETELLVETVCRLGGRRLLDAGTGSGAIAAAVARELPAARVVASDRSCDALDVARMNLATLAPAVTLVRADWLAPFAPASFDVVVSNPPYIPDADLAGLEPEVRDFEPLSALAAGPDGLQAFRVLVTQAPAVLAPGGWLVVEMGAGQSQAVQNLVGVVGQYARCVVERDVAGIERMLAAQVA